MRQTIACLGNVDETSEHSESQNINCTDIKPLPGYDLRRFPFLATRTGHHLNFLDIRNRRTYQVLPDRKPSYDNEFMSVMCRSGGRVVLVFSSTTAGDSADTIRTLKLSKQLLSGLKHFN